MEHSCEAYWTKAEGLARDAICTMGLGAKRLTDAAKRAAVCHPHRHSYGFRAVAGKNAGD